MPNFNEANVYVGRARIRMRDIRAAFKGTNVDPTVIHTFEGLADNDKTQRDQIEALAELVNQQMDLVNRLIFVMEKIKDQVPDFSKLTESATALRKGIAAEAIKLKDPDQT
jgi:hypothetical protein